MELTGTDKVVYLFFNVSNIVWFYNRVTHVIADLIGMNHFLNCLVNK